MSYSVVMQKPVKTQKYPCNNSDFVMHSFHLHTSGRFSREINLRKFKKKKINLFSNSLSGIF